MSASSATSKATKTDTPLMDIGVDRNALLAEVAAAARISESKGTQPILLHLLLEASLDGTLTITSTDLRRGFRTHCGAMVKTPGVATIHAQKFLNYLKLLPEGSPRCRKIERGRVTRRSKSAAARLAEARDEIVEQRGISYVYRLRCGSIYPTREEFFVAAPALVAAKARYSMQWFDEQWDSSQLSLFG